MTGKCLDYKVTLEHKSMTPGYTLFFRFKTERDNWIEGETKRLKMRYGITGVRFIKTRC